MASLSYIVLTFLMLFAFLSGTAGISSSTLLLTESAQSRFFKEILLGRCYQSPPSGESDDTTICPLIVDSFMSVVDGSLDQDIGPESYSLYWDLANFDSDKDTALFVWPPTPSSAAAATILSSSADDASISNENENENRQFTLPETTPGALLIEGLVFCGVDKRNKCPVEFWELHEGAMSAFWQGAYALFSNRIQGVVRMVVLETKWDTIPELWKNSVMPFLNSSTRITSVEVLAVDCQSTGVVALMDSLSENGNVTSTCSTIIQSVTNNGASQWCSVQKALLNDNNNNNNNNLETSTSAPSSFSDAVECRCPASETNAYIFEYLFWILLLLISGCAYAYWSVRHYLPEYQRIPNVLDNHRHHQDSNGNGGQPSYLPKQ